MPSYLMQPRFVLWLSRLTSSIKTCDRMKKRISALIPCIALLTGTYSCNPPEAHQDPVVNGIMIDCSRLMEKREYYYRLINFMSEWEMNTLVLHFSDDHGLSIQLPGYEQLASANAFSPAEIRSLVQYADSLGIDIIPELEVFGHTRYITDHPDYQHLGLGQRDDRLAFNAIDPLHAETIPLLDALIQETAKLFNSEYIHLGCDEVALDGLADGMNEADVWVGHVNTVINLARKYGKQPMIWNDHVRKDSLIAQKLDKDVILVEWNYDPAYQPESLRRLKGAGFQKIIMAPSLACYRLRILPAEPALRNTDAMIPSVKSGDAIGIINTIWLPQRYIQNAMWYGIAYTAFQMNHAGRNGLTNFHAEFAQKVWHTDLTAELDMFLSRWRQLHLHRSFYIKAARGDFDYSDDQLIRLKEMATFSGQLSDSIPELTLETNQDIFDSMVLATRVLEALSQSLLFLGDEDAVSTSKAALIAELQAVIQAVDADWDTGRYSNDPQKYEPKYSNIAHSHLLVVLKMIEAKLLDN